MILYKFRIDNLRQGSIPLQIFAFLIGLLN